MCGHHAKQRGQRETMAYEGQTRRLSTEPERKQSCHGARNVSWFWMPALIWLGIGLVKLLVVLAEHRSAQLLLQPPILLAALCIGVGLWLIARDSAESAKEANRGED